MDAIQFIFNTPKWFCQHTPKVRQYQMNSLSQREFSGCSNSSTKTKQDKIVSISKDKCHVSILFLEHINIHIYF